MTFYSHPGEEASLIALQVQELPGVRWEELGLILSPSNTGTKQRAGRTLSSQENKTLKTRRLDQDIRNLAGGNYSYTSRAANFSLELP